MNVRFYNAGEKIDVMIPFTLLQGADIHCNGSWSFCALKEAWVDVPTEIEVGHESIAVRFAKDVRERYGKRGLIQLDAAWDAKKEDPDAEPEKYPVAATEELCIAKGDVIWKRWLRSVVQSHIDQCENSMSAGGAPKAAWGFTKHAFQVLGIQDPGERYFSDLTKKGGNGHGTSDDVKAILVAQGQMLQTLVTVLVAQASGKPLDAEAIKAAMEPVKTPDTLTSGVMTGKVTKPVDMRGAGPDADIFDRKVKSKTERTKEAIAAL